MLLKMIRIIWFDTNADYQDYNNLQNQSNCVRILGYHHMFFILFYVDNIPVRVAYPSEPMKIQASLWRP
ncbi:unnamed protein product [Prunus brigantina]